MEKEKIGQLEQIEQIEKIIGYSFSNRRLLSLAFVHSSYGFECNVESNERLEFLGDGIINFLIAEMLYDKKQSDEGEMSILRSKIVSRVPLAKEIDNLKLIRFLKVGGAFKNINNVSQKFKSNLYEAIVAAIYKDGGMDAARAFIVRTLLKNLHLPSSRDYKSKLQDTLQSVKKSVEYRDETLSQNPPLFSSKAIIDGKVFGEGEGNSKKSAQQQAAAVALKEWVAAENKINASKIDTSKKNPPSKS